MGQMFIEAPDEEDEPPTLVIQVDPAWQDFEFTDGYIRLKVAPGSWAAKNVPVGVRSGGATILYKEGA